MSSYMSRIDYFMCLLACFAGASTGAHSQEGRVSADRRAIFVRCAFRSRRALFLNSGFFFASAATLTVYRLILPEPRKVSLRSPTRTSAHFVESRCGAVV
jgi:hypothetical protein